MEDLSGLIEHDVQPVDELQHPGHLPDAPLFIFLYNIYTAKETMTAVMIISIYAHSLIDIPVYNQSTPKLKNSSI